MSGKVLLNNLLKVVGVAMLLRGVCVCALERGAPCFPGVLTAAGGGAILLGIFFHWRRNRPSAPLTKKQVMALVTGGIGVGALALGVCMAVAWDILVLGATIGAMGAVLLGKSLPQMRTDP